MIKFWTKKFISYSHKDGLSEEQVAQLQSLKVGDKLVLLSRKPSEDGNSTWDLILKKFEQRPRNDQ